MHVTSVIKSLTCLALVGTAGFVTRASAETEPNGTLGTANTITLDFQTGGTASGELRSGNVSSNDNDFFKFTNFHGYASITVAVSGSFDGAENANYEVLTEGGTPVFQGGPFSFNGSDMMTITSPNPNASFFVRVFANDQNLTTASSIAEYDVMVTGTGGENPLDRFLAKQKECNAHHKLVEKAKVKLREARTAAAKKRAKAALARFNRLHKACHKQLDFLQSLI